VYVLSRFSPRGNARRYIIGSLLAFVLFFNSIGTLLASTVGTISGTVTTVQGVGIGGVRVSAVAPTGRYQTTTDPKGFYSFTGVAPDTYTVSFEATGYQPVSTTGVNVFADQIANVSAPLTKSLVTIGHITSRAPGGAFQPTQTQDTYTVTASQIDTQLGKKDAVSESSLIFTLPGASRDSSGYPVIRGGRENEEGFQYEGIPFTDAFTNQFVNSLALNGGVASLQLTPGAGDATTGNNGTGTLNLISKRGARPAFGQVEVEALAFPYSHQLQAEYGFATPDGRISNYFSFLGTRTNSQFGPRGYDTSLNGAFYSRIFQTSSDFSDNFFYKFGKNQSQSIQVFYENQIFQFYNNIGGIDQNQTGAVGIASGLCFRTCDPFAFANYNSFTNFANGGLTQAEIQYMMTLDPYQTNPIQALNRRSAGYQPNDTFKIQYSNNLDASTYLTMKYFKVNSVVTFDQPYTGASYTSDVALQGGLSTGWTLDATKQLNSKNLIKIGGISSFLHPVFNYSAPPYGLLANTGTFSNSFAAFGFVKPGDFCPIAAFGTPCGYLYNGNAGGTFFPGGVPRVPAYLETTGTNRQDWATYIDDLITPSDKVKIDLGLRVDGTTNRMPSEAPCNTYSAASIAFGLAQNGTPMSVDGFTGANQCLFQANSKDAAGNPIVVITNQQRHPVVLEPRASFNWQFTRNDSVRASFGRSVELAPLGDIDESVARSAYLRDFGFIPPDPSTQALAGNVCGVPGNQPCSSFGDELYWGNQLGIAGAPFQPVNPETFTNYDMSLSHQFGGNIGAKITPFYRRGYDVVAFAQQPRVDSKGNAVLDVNGNPTFLPAVASNDGINRTTGVEFLVTRDAAYGLTGSFSATYINELSNVIPLSASEDFFPTIPAASLALGNVYRVGFLSPFQATAALAYKTHSGLKINPVFIYNHGYPIGNGLLTAAFVKGAPTNVPSTNLTAPGGSAASIQYVDPMNPGSAAVPNIVANRGSELSPSAGGRLTMATITTNLGIELSPPGSKHTFGVFVANLFGNVYALPSINSRWQPVANGIGGPRTGYSTSAPNGFNAGFPGIGIVNYPAERFGYDPFIIGPTNSPTTIRFYYSLSL
jgi:hypothetical protein